MISTPQMRWLSGQPLQIKLAAVEKVWQARADEMIRIADQLSAVGKSQEALDTVLEFAERAAHVCERVSKMSEFGSFAGARVRGIASSGMVKSAVASDIAAGAEDGLDTEALMQVCERLGISV